MSSAPDWVTLFTGVLAVAAVLQFIVFCVQAAYMYRGLSLTKQAADAATRSVQIANRARVRVEAVAFQNIETPEINTFNMLWRMTNTGPTTGHIFEQRNDYFISDQKMLPDDPPYIDKPLPRHIHLGPQQSISVQIDRYPKSKLNMAAVVAEELHIYAFGSIKYRDEFGAVHETRYAAKHRPGQAPLIITQPGYNSST
jgi:hypothetical protein